MPGVISGDKNDAAIQAYINGIGLPGIGYRYDAELDEFVAPEPVEVEAVES